MPDRSTYAVFLHPQAIEALGPAIQPYLTDSPVGPHLSCAEIDSGGSLFEMTLIGRDAEGKTVEVELMVPVAMVKLVVSIRREDEFGFGPRETATAAPPPTPPLSTAAPGAAST